MKLVKETRGAWQYILNKNEAALLVDLLRKFPFTEDAPAKITRTDLGEKAAERGHLLHEFLAEHRKELQKHARSLLAAGRFQPAGDNILVKLNADEREFLLQILNDIRLGAWRALGEPENEESSVASSQPQERALHSVMILAGYFEQHLVSHE